MYIKPAVPSTLILIVNPSRRAHELVFRHAADIVQGVAGPRMNLIGIYEQRTSDDGYPFDRAFVTTRSPWRPPPQLTPLPQCSGTNYQRKRCERENKKVREREVAAQDQWHVDLDRDVRKWREDVIEDIGKVAAAEKTEESPDGVWDLRGALMTAGHTLKTLKTPVRCIVLLGGLAVRQPPPHLPTNLLTGTTLIAAGWRGTPRVQEAWNEVLAPAGARMVFLPEAVTDVELVGRVRQCLAAPPSEAAEEAARQD